MVEGKINEDSDNQTLKVVSRRILKMLGKEKLTYLNS